MSSCGGSNRDPISGMRDTKLNYCLMEIRTEPATSTTSQRMRKVPAGRDSASINVSQPKLCPEVFIGVVEWRDGSG